MIHVVLIVLAKLIINEVPGISDAMKWTIVNMGYMLVSYCIFHYVKGAPLDLNSGAYDELTLWEQIDQGYQYTPVSYTHLRAHETVLDLVCRLLLEKKK